MLAEKSTGAQVNSRAKMKHICVLIRWLQIRWIERKHPHITTVKPEMLQDIGLTDADLASRRHKLPSQYTFHPRG